MVRMVIVATVAALVWSSVARGEDAPAPAPAPPQDSTPVARVLGKPITRADLEAQVAASGNGEGEPDWGAVLRRVAMEPLLERYIVANELRATDAEIEAFVKTLGGADELMREKFAAVAKSLRAKLDDPATPEQEREGIREELARAERYAKGELWPDAKERDQLAAEIEDLRRAASSPDLSAEDRAAAADRLAYAERFRGLTDDQAREEFRKVEAESKRSVAAPFIEWWKFNRSLYKAHGGRIMFQQAGLEAFDATRIWLQEQEKAGDLVILDTTLLPGFWAYYTMDQSELLISEPTGTEFDLPWWARTPAE